MGQGDKRGHLYCFLELYVFCPRAGYTEYVSSGVHLFIFYPAKQLQDNEMHRGKPLYLNEERYAALTHMVKELLLALLILFPHFFFLFFCGKFYGRMPAELCLRF